METILIEKKWKKMTKRQIIKSRITSQNRYNRKENGFRSFFKRIEDERLATLPMFDKLQGIIMSDGHLSPVSITGKSCFRLTQRYDRYELIQTTRDFLNSLGFITYEREFIIENLATKYVQLATYHYTYFGNLRKQWYKNGNGKKYVSDRFTLNEKSLAYWFMCDGSAKRQGNVTIIHLATYGFDEKSNSNLLSELKRLGLKVILTKKQTITKFQNQLNNYLDYVKGFCYLGYSKRKKKYVLKMSKRTWWIRRTRKKMELQGRAE